MTINHWLVFAVRMCWREFKAGELNVLLGALIIAIISHTAIGFFTDRLDKAMTYRARDLIGADTVLQSPRPVAKAWLDEARQADLRISEVLLFSSVVLHGDNMLLVSVKAVDQHYPLKAGLKTSISPYAEAEETRHGPRVGEAWVENRVLNELDMQIGQQLSLGSSTFTVSRVLNFEPDRGSSFYGFTPRVMIHSADLAQAELLQDGSRVDYQYLFSGEENAIAEFAAKRQTQLTPGQNFLSPGQQQPTLGNALTRAQRFMGLASALAVVLAAVAIAVSAGHYSLRHYDSAALLRCMGCKQNAVFFIHVVQLLLVSTLACVLGTALGWSAHHAFIILLRAWLPDVLPTPGWRVVFSGWALAYGLVLGFALPSLLRLREVSPLRVLRKELEPLPISAWLVYGGAFIFIFLLMWFYTGQSLLALSVLAGVLGVVLLTFLLVGGIFCLLEKSVLRFSSTTWVGLRNVLRRKNAAVAQTLAFGLTLMAMLVVLFLRTHLLSEWQASLPDNTPNHFVINILPEDLSAFEHYLQTRSISVSALYPMSRGRLISINGVPVTQAVSKEEKDNESLNRELNLSWSEHMGADNRLLAGEWWDSTRSPEQPEVSIEARLAKKLGIQVGDRLGFFTGGQEWQATVKSIRSVKWESFQPNFYFLFDPRSIEHLPATYMTSLYLAPSQKIVLKEMVKAFPAISVFEMDAILLQLKSIVKQVSLAIEYVLLFVLLAGFMVTLASIQASLQARLQEAALMRTLGASRRLIRRGQWSEFACIGFVAGLVAVAGTELIHYLIATYLLSMDYQTWWTACLLLPLLSALLIASMGWYGSRKVLSESPMRILRDA